MENIIYKLVNLHVQQYYLRVDFLFMIKLLEEVG